MRGKVRAALGAVAVAIVGSTAPTALAGDARFVEESGCGSGGCSTIRSLQITTSYGTPGKLRVDLDQLVASFEENAITTTGVGCRNLSLNIRLVTYLRLPTVCSGLIEDPLTLLLQPEAARVVHVRLLGTGASDTLTAQTGPRSSDRLLFGRAVMSWGNDVLVTDADSMDADMGEGDDRFVSNAENRRPDRFLLASAYGGPGADHLQGGSHRNLLSGGPGPDVIVGGGGADILMGGDADDHIDARDGETELDISCGAGQDVAVVDASDAPRADCETVQVG